MPAIITVENLSKAYRIGHKEQIPDTLVGAAKSWISDPLRNLRNLRKLDTFSEDQDAEDIVWALRDVSFEIQQGEVVGIIGRNGAGKSTLLKILSNITEPTSGRAIIRGRISSLLEVGTGFHQEMTGRDNIYMNGTILGMTKGEIDRKFDEIVDFSGVERFLDTPIKRYSSGMQVRLAFSVAAHLEPEILIIDEVLAVGDADFQSKCLGKMKNVANDGRTVLFVSHNSGVVRSFCKTAVVLEEGGLSFRGDCFAGLDYYKDRALGNMSNKLVPSDTNSTVCLNGNLVKQIELQTSYGKQTSEFQCGESVVVSILLTDNAIDRKPDIGLLIEDAYGQVISTVATYLSPFNRQSYRSDGRINCVIDSLPLAPDSYYWTLKVGHPASNAQEETFNRCISMKIVPFDYYAGGKLPRADRGPMLIRSKWVTDLSQT